MCLFVYAAPNETSQPLEYLNMLNHGRVTHPARPDGLPMTRRQRRAAERRAAKEMSRANAGPLEKHHNGIRFHGLTRVAFKNVCEQLINYENKLSSAHMDGLMFQAGIFTLKAQRRLPGRHQVTLAPGIGKTEGVVAWAKALVSQGHAHIGVAVAASKVEELATIKRKMIAAGTPADRVGLRHEYTYDPEVAQEYLDGTRFMLPEGYASEPSEGHNRQVLLITHARIMQSDPETYLTYRGEPRVVIYDEALTKSKATTIPLAEVDIALYALDKRYNGEDTEGDRKEARDYLHDVFATLQATHKVVKETGEGTVVPTEFLPKGTEADLLRFKRSLPHKPGMDALRTLLDVLADQPSLKVVQGQQGTGGVVTYDIVIPEVLDNVAILDASYPVRDLLHRDKGIIPGEQDEALRKAFAGKLDIASMDLSKIKRYSKVTIKQARIPGGRTSMEKDIGGPADHREVRKEDSKVLAALVDTVKDDIPAEDHVLIFTFKDRGGFKFRDSILTALGRAGVNLDRVHVVTWGMETAMNNYAHCQHVILAGVIRRDRLELEGAILGQEDEGLGGRDVTQKDVSDADLGEVLHAIYQALNRGACRNTVSGEAKPMTAWVMHKARNIREPLSRIMPGLRWEKWKTPHFEEYEGSADEAADKVVDHLETKAANLPKKNSLKGTWRVSFRALREELGLAKEQPGGLPDKTWTNARRIADDRLPAGWVREGNSYVYQGAKGYGFTND